VTAFFQELGLPFEGAWLLSTIIGILLIALPVMLAVAMIIYADRKIWAAMALRRGPNVVGPFGLLQSFADMIKFVLKEVVIPSGADKAVFILAPVITVVLAFMAWAVIPFAPGWVVSDLNVGILYIFAVSSLGVYGIIMGGWASNSKYPFLGSLRSAAQMVSYEVSLGLIIINVILLAGTMNLSQIVEGQSGYFWNWYAFGGGQGTWPLIVILFPMSIVFFVSAQMRVSSACMISRVCASSAAKGSSISRICAPAVSARAMLTRCFIPPLIWCGYWPMRCSGAAISTWRSASTDSRSTSAFDPRSRRMISAAVFLRGNSPKYSSMYWISSAPGSWGASATPRIVGRR